MEFEKGDFVHEAILSAENRGEPSHCSAVGTVKALA